MCGRYAMNQETDELIREFVADGGKLEDWAGVFSVAPRTRAPIIREWQDDDSGEVVREAELATWGLRPSWAKEGGPAPINARLEGVATNGMFRGPFAGQRAIVPMTGYYEWVEMDDGKQPYFIHSGDELLAAAGLYAARKVDDEWKITFTVITRAAADASGEVHDRMPVFLTKDVWGDWLSPTKLDDKEGMVAMLDAVSLEVASTIVTHPVSRAVNNVRTLTRTDPALIEPISL